MDSTLLQVLGLGVGGVIVAWAERARVAAWFAAQRAHWLARLSEGVGESLPPVAQLASPTSSTSRLIADGRRLLLVGAPGSGKSTAARALVRDYRAAGADVVICDPDGAAWPKGCKMVGSPDDWSAIDAELQRIAAIASSRRVAYQRGVRSFMPLLVLVDEAPMVLRSCTDALPIISDLARRGRKLAISVMLLSQDTQSRTLGLEGQTKLLEAFDRFDCRMRPDGVALFAGDTLRGVIPLDHGASDLVLPLAELQPAESFLAAELLKPSGTGSRGSHGSISGAEVVPDRELVPAAEVVPAVVPPDTNAVPAGFDAETIRALKAAGWSNNRIAEKLGGRRAEALARIRTALGE